MSKKMSALKSLTPGKLAGIIFCVIAAVCAVILMFAGGYFGGQMKVIDKYLTALERDDFKGYAACFPEDISGKLGEVDFEAAKSVANVLADSEDFRITAAFKNREKLESGRYAVTFDLTVYNDNGHETIENVTGVLIRQGGGWVIEGLGQLLDLLGN